MLSQLKPALRPVPRSQARRLAARWPTRTVSSVAPSIEEGCVHARLDVAPVARGFPAEKQALSSRSPASDRDHEPSSGRASCASVTGPYEPDGTVGSPVRNSPVSPSRQDALTPPPVH